MAIDMADYMKNRRADRRARLITLLGGQCSVCFSIEDLEIDHIDPATKSFVLSGHNLDKPWDKILAEAKKCQLLCNDHHRDKSIREDSVRRPLLHGTETMYLRHKCRCTECKAAYAVTRSTYPSRRKKVA